MSRLFVYGTLRRDSSNSEFGVLGRGARFVGSGKMQGRLFQLGDYPGLVPCCHPHSWVEGEVYAIENQADTLARLDEFEGCSPNDPEPHEFERIRNTVVRNPGTRDTVWVYVYRGLTAGKREIVSGDYVADGRGQLSATGILQRGILTRCLVQLGQRRGSSRRTSNGATVS